MYKTYLQVYVPQKNMVPQNIHGHLLLHNFFKISSSLKLIVISYSQGLYLSGKVLTIALFSYFVATRGGGC